MSNSRSCVGKEGFQRMNYLYQLSNEYLTENQAGHSAAWQYSNLLINISKKTVQRLDIEVKRTICKKCRSLLIPGVTCKVRIKKKRVLKHCIKCHQFKTFYLNKDYSPWTQRNNSLVEVLDYTPVKTNETNMG